MVKADKRVKGNKIYELQQWRLQLAVTKEKGKYYKLIACYPIIITIISTRSTFSMQFFRFVFCSLFSLAPTLIEYFEHTFCKSFSMLLHTVVYGCKTEHSIFRQQTKGMEKKKRNEKKRIESIDCRVNIDF